MTVARRVAFSETDASGRVHFTTLLKWAEDAEHQFLSECGVDVFASDSGWPRVSVSCDYHRPLAFGDEVQVAIELVEIGESSLKWHFQVLNESGERVAKGQLVTVWVVAGKKATIPAETSRLLKEASQEGA
jgi:acyl-CoA thioester hydrolase